MLDRNLEKLLRIRNSLGFILCDFFFLTEAERPQYDDDVMKQLRTEDDCQYKKTTEPGKEYQVAGAMCNLFQNPTFLMVTLSAIAESINVAGIATFLPKFIQNHFHQTPSWASMLAGKCTPPLTHSSPPNAHDHLSSCNHMNVWKDWEPLHTHSLSLTHTQEIGMRYKFNELNRNKSSIGNLAKTRFPLWNLQTIL